MKILDFIKLLFGIAKKVVPSVDVDQSYYTKYIGVWKQVYQGYYEEWHKLNTLQGGTRTMASMQVAKLLCAEASSLVFSEKVEINIDNEQVDTYVKEVLKQNGFQINQSELIEYMFAIGGAINKGRRENDRTVIDFMAADKFIPTKWTNTTITEGMFLTNTYKDKYIYTLAEQHSFDGTNAMIENKLFKRRKDSGNQQGIQVDLKELYPDLDEIIIIENAKRSLFSYTKPNIGNNFDMDTPLGVSLFGNSLDTIKSLDIAFDSFQREFVLGKKRIVVPAHALKPVVDPQTGAVSRYFDPNVDVYEGINLDGNDAPVKDDTQVLRVEEHVAAINALLNILCIQTGFSAGFITFDAGEGLKTATEVVSENSKTYRTKVKHEKALKKNFEELVDIIMTIGILHGDIGNLDYNVEVVFDDSVVEDKAAEIVRYQLELGMGVISKVEYRMKRFGETEEQAKEALGKIEPMAEPLA